VINDGWGVILILLILNLVVLHLEYLYTQTMSTNRRIQVPVSPAEETLMQSAARIFNISTAEWARRILRKAAQRDLSASICMDPIEALEAIKSLQAPVGSVKTMKKQSVKGRRR